MSKNGTGTASTPRYWPACGVHLFAAALLVASTGNSLSATTHYVDLNSTNATPPYTNWAIAATNIQDAVDAAVAGDEIVVTNGTYASGGRAVYGNESNRVAVAKPLTLRSVSGPQFTIVSGGWTYRCVYLTNGASLSGFTLISGVAEAGGGVWCESASAAISNCVLVANTASIRGGGACQGTLNNCTLSGNTVASFDSHSASNAVYGGGAYGCTLNNCVLTGNYAETYYSCSDYSGCTAHRFAYGGGACGCMLNHCTLADNSSYNEFDLDHGTLTAYGTAEGGGAFGCVLNSCTLTNNKAENSYDRSGITAYDTATGGGASESTLTNCTLSRNYAGYGGGTSGGTLSNCTLNCDSALQTTLDHCALTASSAETCALNNCRLTGSYAETCALNNCLLTGGGAFYSTLRNSAVTGGPGVYSSTLINCTLTGNSVGAVGCSLTNCIAYFNTGANYDGSCTLNYC